MKQGNEIVNDVWQAVKDSGVYVDGGVYKYLAPIVTGNTPQKENIVVDLLSALSNDNRTYNALVIVNIFVPNVTNVFPNEKRFQAIATTIIDYLKKYNGKDFQLTTDVAGRLNRAGDGKYFYTLRFFYATIN